jgi:uncharacterized protein (TIRG00374 family)
MKLLLRRQGMSISLSDIIGINFGTNFYGLFLPGGHLTGTLIRWYRFSKSDGKPSEAMASIIFDRVVDITILCLLGVVFWALDRPYDRSYIGLSLGAILGGLSLFYALMFTRVAVTSQMSLNYLIGLPLIPKVVSSKVGKLITSLSQYKDLSYSYLAILVSISFVYQFIGIVAAYFFVLALDLKISLITIAWVRSARLVIAMLPISISGVGVREWTSVFLLTPYGVSAADAIALSLLSYGSRLWLGAIGGLLEAANFFRPARRKSNEKSSGIKKEKLTL